MKEKDKLPNSGMDIPDETFLRIADVLLPIMQDFFESEEGRAAIAEWQNESEQKEAVSA